jgi:pyruvate,orthophosphate dikinase
MVFGNMGETSATGVAFTRDPSTGEQGIFGEVLLNAQGEDVVAGIRTPRPLREMEQDLPNAYRQFLETAQRLERENQDMQDVEFTVERTRCTCSKPGAASAREWRLSRLRGTWLRRV